MKSPWLNSANPYTSKNLALPGLGGTRHVEGFPILQSNPTVGNRILHSAGATRGCATRRRLRSQFQSERALGRSLSEYWIKARCSLNDRSNDSPLTSGLG